jgi:hypothetical protein
MTLPPRALPRKALHDKTSEFKRISFHSQFMAWRCGHFGNFFA